MTTMSSSCLKVEKFEAARGVRDGRWCFRVKEWRAWGVRGPR